MPGRRSSRPAPRCCWPVGHARVHGREIDGAVSWQAPLGAGAVDVGIDGDARYVLTDEGHVLRLELGREVARSTTWRDEQRHAVALDAAAGRVALLDLRSQELRLLDERLVQTIAIDLAPEGTFGGIVDVALSGQHVVLARASAGMAEIRDLAGRPVATADVPAGAVRVAAGRQDEFVALSAAGWALRFDATGHVSAAWPVGAPEDAPVDLAVGEEGRVFVADARGAVRVYAPDESSPQAAPPAPPSMGVRCAVLANKGASPSELLLGEAVEVTLSLTGACPREEVRSDVVLAIDRSASMRGAKLSAARDAALAFAAQMDPLLARVAVVGFAGRAERLLPLTSDRNRILDAVLDLRIEEWTDVVAALDASHAALTGGLGRPDVKRVIVLLTDGRHWDPLRGEVVDPPGLPAVLERLRSDGIEVYAVGLGDDANAPLLRAVAGDESRYLRSPTTGELRTVYRDIARHIEATRLLRQLELRDMVPVDMDYEPGSGRPVEPDWDPAERTLTWRLADVAEPGVELRYRLRPRRAGLRPTNVEAISRFVDGFGHAGEAVHPVPRVRVVDPEDPRPLGGRLWLPLALGDRCVRPRAKIVIMADTSTSMRAALGSADGPSRLEAQRQAVITFVRALEPAPRTVSLLRFDDSVELVARGAGGGELAVALGRLWPRPGTRLDRALRAAGDELQGQGAFDDPTTRATVVLWTDGLVAEGGAAGVGEAAAALVGRGARLRVLALGDAPDAAVVAALRPHGAVAVASDLASLTRVSLAAARFAAPCRSDQAWPDAPAVGHSGGSR